MRRLKRLSLIACLVVAASSFAQDHPNEDHGFKPDKMYSFTDLDHINTFNGNLVITLPLGQKFQVSPMLSYGFSAVYNSNIWDLFYFGPGNVKVGPSTVSNAGAGWSVSLGRFLSWKDPSSNLTSEGDYLLITPDGSRHQLSFQFPIPTDPIDSTWKSYDSTYIFLTGRTRDPLVHMPDGTKYFFSDTGDRIHYRLSAIFDRFGNWVNVQYPTVPGYSEVWKVEDSQGHKQTLYFTDAIGTTFPQKLLDRIERETFAGGSATWKFNYSYRFIQRPPSDSTPGLIKVAFLREIVEPGPLGDASGPKYSFTTPGSTGLDPDPSYDTSGNATGRINAMQLPTRGWIEWDLDDLQFPVDPEGLVALGPNNIVGVQARRQLDRDRNPLGEWKYFHRWGCGGKPCLTPSRWAPCYPDAPKQLVAMIQNPDNTTLVRYYHIYFHPNCWDSPSVDWNNNEYASPFTSFTRDPEERRLSWELRTGVDPDDPSVYNEGSIGTGTVLRTYFTHWQQIYAFGGDVTQTNRREQSSRTVFNDDRHCGTSGTETCYQTMSKFGFIDEFGLYRQESEGGNFPNAKFRTRFTNYDGTLDADKDWILGTYTEQCSVDENTSRLPARVWAQVVPVAKCSDLTNAVTTKYKFDRSKGVIDAKRTLLGSALSKTDLLTTFTRDSKGNVTYERFYGGDTSDQQLFDSESTMFDPPSSAKYEIANTYIYDGTALTTRQSKYTGSSFLIFDEDYDKWTGMVKASRDAAGVETSYTYDTLGRLHAITEQTASGQNTTSSYIYSDATSTSNAVASELATVGGINGTLLSSGSYEYDGLGRLKRTSRLLPNDQVSVVQIDYDSMGRKSRESQPAEYDKHPFGKNVTGYWTSYAYDSFGRPSSVTSPDGGGASFSYLGARESTHSKWVASSQSGNSLASTTETHDAQGRLVAVTEDSGDTRIDKPQGDSVTTNYTYDVRGNLTGVSMGTQTRTFQYDGRGFLTRETGPEAGDTVFSNFDAKGHALQRTQGGNTLTYVYDAAERLTHVKNAAGDDIKFFDFATANSGADKRNGKLIKAVRRNELQTLGIVEVTETYQYLFPSGQMSKRSVLVEKVETGGARTTLQQFDYHIDAYDDFGQPKKVRMPVCASVACEGAGIAQVDNTRKAGFLTSVDGFGTMTYHPSGMVESVRHTTRDFSTDTYSARQDMPRPSKITFEGCAATQPYFLPGLVRAKVDPNACGIQVTWPAATLCGGAGNTRYRVLRDGVDITGGACITETKFVDRTAVRGNTYLYKIVAEGPAVDGGTGLCQRGQTVELAGKPFEFKSCDADTILTVENVRASLGVAARFQAYLGSANGPLPDEELTFSVLGSLIGTARTGTDGKAVLDRTVDAEPGTYAGAISVSYAGGLFPAKTGTANLTTACDGLSYGVKPLSLNVLAAGGTFPALVLTSPRCSWTPIPRLASFIGVEPRTQQKGTGKFDIFVPPLEGGGTRSSYVRVSDKEVTIEQSSSCTFQFSPEVAYVPYKTPFSTSINVTAAADCAWSVQSDSSWLHLTKSSGTGDGFITFTVSQNNSNPRMATLALNGGEDKAKVNQAGPPEMIAPTRVTDLTGPGSVRDGQFISLRAQIEGTYLEYEWYINGRPRGTCFDERCESMNLAPGNDGYPGPGQSTSFQLVVSNLLDSVVTREITVFNQGESCRVPIITDGLFINFTPWDQNSPFGGYEVQLYVVGLNTAAGGELKYQWYEGFADDRSDKISDLLGGKTDTIKVRPGRTTHYWVEVTNNCGTNISRTAAVYVIPFDPPRIRRRAVRKDFTGDGKADIPWHNTATGQNEIWPMNGATQSSSTITLSPSSANLQLQSIGDIDDNERPDLIFRDPQTGQNQVWRMSNSQLLGVSALETRTDGRWSIGGVADLDNDYNDDVIWHNNATGENEIWFQAGTDHEGTWALPSNSGPGWGLHGADDFNGDGKPDLFFHDRTTGQNSVWYMNDAERSFEVGTNSNGSSPSTTRKLKTIIEPMASSLSTEWMPGMVGDFDGDGRPDIVWRNTATGDNRVWFMTGTTVQQDTELPARSGSEWQIGGGGSTNAGTPGGGTDPGGTTTTSVTVVADPAPLGTAAAITATLKAGSTALAQRQIVFALNGTEVSRLLTDATGSATAAISVTSLAAGTYPGAITVRFDGDHTYSNSSASANLVVLGPTPEVTWANPAPIVYGTPLSAAQLDATATVAGTFAYSPAAGAIVNAGYQTLTAVFTPADPSIAPMTRNAILFVNKAPSSVTWARPESIPYGTPLSDLQLNATSSLAGELTYDPAPGALLPVGNAQTLGVTFTPESANYDVSSATTTIDVARGGQVIRWSDPAPITYPAPLTDAQLNATVIASGTDPAGALTYAPPAGTVLAEGVHELKVTAAATASYEAASFTVDLIVNRKSAMVEWTSPEPVTYGTPLSATQLNATATVPGTFVYTPAAGAVLDAGTHYLNVQFTPADTGVEPVSQTVTIRVLKVKPVVTWGQPAAIVYGTPLSSAQLNATANVAGSMVYDPAAGTILDAGTHEVLASFTPTDTRNYEVAAATVMLTVNKAPQTITWPSPAPIVYGTALSPAQLDATVSVVGPAPAGALAYNPPAGTVLQAGAAQVLTVTAAATPNYEVAAKSVTIDVLKATPVLTWPQPAPIVYKTVLSGTQLDAGADVPGTFVYTPPAGTLLQAGTYTLSAQFTPADTHNYNNAGASVTLEVERANPVLTWAKPAGIVYGTPLGATQLNATADVPGAFTYTPAAATILDAGDGQTLSVHFRPDDTRNYNDADTSTTLDVAKARQTIRWSAPAPIVYGTPLSATQLNARVEVVGPSPAGALTYTPPSGTVLDAGTRTLTVDAAGTHNYEAAMATVTLQVNRAPLSVAVDVKSKLYGHPVPPLTGVLTGVQNNDPITPSYATIATQQSPTGTYPITATLLDPNNRLVNYDVTITPSTLTINPAPLLIAANAVTKQYSDPVPLLTATYTGFVLGETPAVLSGVLAIQTTAVRLSAPGTYPITIGGLTSTNYAIAYAGATLTVVPEDARVYVSSPLLLSAAASGPTTITLAATVRDISATPDANGDVDAGDIRKATLTFVDRATNAVLCTAPIGLAADSDERVAIAMCTFTRDFGAALPASIVVGSRVAGYYTRDAAADDVTLSVLAPGDDFVTAAGSIIPGSPLGPHAPDAGGSARFEFNLRYDNKGIVQGRMVLTFTRTVNGAARDYELAAASIGSLAIQRTATGGIAAIVGTGTLRDVTQKNAAIVIAEAAPMVVTATDGGQPAAGDALSFTLYKPAGGLWMATGWDGIRAVEQPLQQGAVGVHPGH